MKRRNTLFLLLLPFFCFAAEYEFLTPQVLVIKNPKPYMHTSHNVVKQGLWQKENALLRDKNGNILRKADVTTFAYFIFEKPLKDGNKFLSHIREVDAIIHVVRCFEDEKIIHVEGNVDPKRDIETINLELILADLESVTKYEEKEYKLVKSGAGSRENLNVLNRIKTALENEKCARTLNFTEEEKEYVKSLFLLTTKPVIYVANIAENNIDKDANDIPLVREVFEYADLENAETLVLSCKIEEELIKLDPEERDLFKTELGLQQSGLEKLIVTSYKTLGLMSYLTAGEKEVRAWTIVKGTKAPQAAGKIHSDFERGFIRADIVKYDDLILYGSYNSAKEKGKVASVGKDYVMQEGDIVLFKFNV